MAALAKAVLAVLAETLRSAYHDSTHNLLTTTYSPRLYSLWLYSPRLYPPRLYSPRLYSLWLYPPRLYPPWLYPPRLYSP